MTLIQYVPNQNFNPLVDLPISIDNITNCDAILVTHTHRDHFDDDAAKLLPKGTPIFFQPEDKKKFLSYGFTNVYSIYDTYIWYNITFNRTNGKHGHGKIAVEMAPVSGYVISFSDEPSIYIAGDTVWCREVEESIDKFLPKSVVYNCRSAQFTMESLLL